jgi:hypothetical protein
VISPLVCHRGQGAPALSVLISYEHTPRYFLLVSERNVMVIRPILGRQGIVCDNRGHHCRFTSENRLYIQSGANINNL